MHYAARHDPVRRCDRGGSPARRAEGDAVRLRQPGADRPARGGRRPHVAVRRRRHRRPRRAGAAPGEPAAPVARRADRHRRDRRSTRTASATAATTSPSWPARHVRAGRRAAVDRHAAGRRDVAGAAGRRRPPGPAGGPGRRRAVGVPALAAVASALGVHHPGDDPPAAARRLLGVVPAVLGDDGAGDGRPGSASASPPCGDRTPSRRSDRRSTGRSCCWPTTSWPRARSPCASPARRGPARTPAFTAGLATVQGRAPRRRRPEAYELLVECEQVGAAAAVTRRLQARQRLPGFGHMIYKGDDPRLAPLLEVVAGLPDPQRSTAGRRRPARPRPACASRGARTSTSGSARWRSSAACPATCRCSPSPASPGSPPTWSRSSRSARCATAAWPARRRP